MKLIMARRLDPWTGYDAYRNDQPRTIQLEIRDNGELHTRWGSVIAQRIEGQIVHMTERSRTNERTEDFTIPLGELERLKRVPDWTRLPDERPTAFWRTLSREGYATLAMRADPQGQLRGDYILLTIYQAIHWCDDGSCITTSEEFFSGEGNEGAIDQASMWSLQVEQGELRPLAHLQFVDVELAVGMTVKIIDADLNNRPTMLGEQQRDLNGKEAVIVEEWKRARTWGTDASGQWKSDGGQWYVECEGERLRYPLHGGQGRSGKKQISASSYVLSDLDTQGQIIREQQYNEADHYEVYKHLDHLAKQAGHSTIRFTSAADLAAWHPTYRVIAHPHPQKEGSPT